MTLALSPAAVVAQPGAAELVVMKSHELVAVSHVLADIQARAETDPAVGKALNIYRNSMQSEMVRTSPELKADIDRQAQIAVELTASPAGAGTALTPEQQQAELNEYRVLYEKLLPVESRVRDMPAVQLARADYYRKLIAQMQRIDSRTPSVLSQIRTLTEEIQALRARTQIASRDESTAP